MTRTEVIKKLAAELLGKGVYLKDDYDTVVHYLSMAYGAGFDIARRQAHPGKAIMQLSKENSPIKIWENATAAAHALGLHSAGLRRCANGKMKHSGGFRWKFVDQEDPKTINDVEESIKSALAKSDQQQSKSRASKINRF